MHTLREPLLRKQSSPLRGDSVDSSPDDRLTNYGDRKKDLGKDRGQYRKFIVAGIAVIALAGTAFVARQDGYRMSIPFAASVWKDFTSSQASSAPAVIKEHPAVAHRIMNQGAVKYKQAAQAISPHSATMLPQWVQTAIVNDNTDLANDQKTDHKLSGQITQLSAQNQQLSVHVHQLQTFIMNDQLRMSQLEGRLHALAAQPHAAPKTRRRMPGSTSTIGLVALQAQHKPDLIARGHPKPVDRPAKGWVVVAVHGDKAVLQTPGGQVALVQQGPSIGGKTVDGINDSTQTVTLSGGFVAHVFGKKGDGNGAT